MATSKTVHRLELVPEQRAQGKVAPERQVVDVTLRASNHLLLTVEEAAERLGVGRSTLYVLMARGEVASLRVGRLRRIEPEALTAFIARHRADQPPPAA